MIQEIRLVLWAIVLLMTGCLPVHAEMIWTEGESAQTKRVLANAGLDAVDVDELSAGAWVSSFSENGHPAGTVIYTVNVAKPAKYTLWVRANPNGTGLAYRVDSNRWNPVDIKQMQEQNRKALQDWQRAPKAQTSPRQRIVDTRSVSLDATPGFRDLAWMNLASIDLGAGEHKVEFLLGSDSQSVKDKMFNAIDVFVLTDDAAFTPKAKFKPGEGWPQIVALKPKEVWDFTPQPDDLSPKAALDLRSLNEPQAGASGLVRLSADGMSFVTGDGKPVRFWGGSDYNQRDLKLQELVRHGEFLAKRGVNIVRWHGELAPSSGAQGQPNPGLADINAKELDEVFKLVAAMKQAGIYTIISPYWGSSIKTLPDWDIPDNNSLSALLFFYPKVQEAYKGWLRTLYTKPNPYSGVALKDEPAVAIIQIQNEDSMLFWTMQNVKGEPLMVLRKQFAQWVAGKYGSFDRAMEAWENCKHPDDDEVSGTPGMFIVWEFTADARKKKGGPPGREQRLFDQLQFMAETMYNWNREVARFLREDIGAKQLVNAGNWRTVDTLTEDAERWSYTANEVIGKNHYFEGQHKGINVGWQILDHQYFSNPSATLKPEDLPVNVKQVVGHPFIIPESLWVPPMMYQSEGPLMIAAQTSLMGMGPFFWFADGAREWQQPGNKWTYATPMQLGQFPAAALMYRKGYIATGSPVVVEHRGLQDIWSRKTPLIAEGRAYDPNRDVGDLPANSSVKTEIDPLAFVVGPVHVKYDSDPSKTTVADLSRYIDRDRKVVHSITGEIVSDYGRGLYLVNASKVQGAAGFLSKAGALELRDLTITCSNDYATIAVVPLDDQSLDSSHRVLIQVGTVCRATGWQARPARFQADGQIVSGLRILDVGHPPWQIEKTHATVSLRNASLKRAQALDANGIPQADVAIERQGDRVSVQLPTDALYTILTAE